MAVRYFVETSSSVLKSATDFDLEPTPAGHTAVLRSTIAAVWDEAILIGGKWDGSAYTPPDDYVAPPDPNTDAGSVQIAAGLMMDTFESACELIRENRLLWPAANISQGLEGIHWQIIAAARVALNSTRPADERIKFLEECASWPTGVSGDVVKYVDAMSTPADFGEKWSWVMPESPFTRVPVGMAPTAFEDATNVEAAPSSSDLLGRAWIMDIP